jgi:hypothetical protein
MVVDVERAKAEALAYLEARAAKRRIWKQSGEIV